MTTIVHLADSHFDTTSRFSECVAMHDVIAEHVERLRPDVVVHAGDVFERLSTIEERNAAGAFFARCARAAKRVVIVGGNHDVPGDLAIFGHIPNVVVMERPGVVQVGDLGICCLPWPRKEQVLATLGVEVSGEAAGAVAQEALRDVIRGMGRQASETSARWVLAAHASTRGSVTSAGQPLVGMDMELTQSDFALCGASAVLLGHIHMGQDWTWQDHTNHHATDTPKPKHGIFATMPLTHRSAEVPIIYPGSPRRTEYGELEEKGFVVVRLEGDRVAWERIAVPAQRMVLMEVHWNGRFFETAEGEQLHEGHFAVTGADVRFRYHVTHDQREAAKAALEDVRETMEAVGVAKLTTERVAITVHRERAPHVRTARTWPEKLAVAWEARGEVVPPEQRERVLAHLERIMQQQAARSAT